MTKLRMRDIQTHLKAAFVYAELSNAVRLKVGCLIVKDNRVISIGVNGMPSKWSNVCEHEDENGNLVTKEEVLHAESNAISKLARSTESGEGAVMFLTHNPCIHCSKLIYQAGISKVFYVHDYRLQDGVEFLEKCKGITIHKIPLEEEK